MIARHAESRFMYRNARYAGESNLRQGLLQNMVKRMSVLLIIALCFLSQAATHAVAAEPVTDSTQLTLARIFTDKEFKEDKIEFLRWSKKGACYFALEESGDAGQKGKDLVRHDPETGERKVIVSAKEMIDEKSDKPLQVEKFELSPDESQILLFTNARKVWRQKTRGDYWVFSVADRQLRKLGGDAEPSSLMFAKFSPDGTRVAFASHRNLYVQNLEDFSIVQLTKDGSETLLNGISDWANEEEFRQRDGFRWSPDSSRIAFWQFDIKEVTPFLLLDQTKPQGQQVTSFAYPKVGEKNSAIRVGVVPASGGDVVWLDIPGDPSEHYLPLGEWTPDGTGFLVQQFNRQQNMLTLYLANPMTGATRVVFIDCDAAWVEHRASLNWIGKDVLWLSERSGWRHAYRVSLNGEVTPITHGDYDIIDVSQVDAEGGWLYYIASPANPTQRYLFRTHLQGGEPERLSPVDQSGTHTYDISQNADWAIHTYSSFRSPPVADLVSLPVHRSQRTLKSQSNLLEKLSGIKIPHVEFFRLDIGQGIEVDGYLIRAADFDESQPHPLLMHVYGEPLGQTVKDDWGGARGLWHWMLAQQGYVVASVDTRGTNTPRGRDWRKGTYRQLGILNAREQAEAARAMLKKFTFLDPNRVGIWGWSGGGSSSLDAILQYPDLYRTAIAVAPLADRKLYDTIYEERYMGTPKDNPDGYRDGSPITHAAALKGNLLIVHGTGDDNVHYRATERFVNELIVHNKRFTLMPYPNRDHSINEGPETSRHLYELITHYLQQHLKSP